MSAGDMCQPSNKVIWRHGSTVAKGFINPEHDMVYLENQNHDHGFFIVLSIQDMAEIIVAHQRRTREERYERDSKN